MHACSVIFSACGVQVLTICLHNVIHFALYIKWPRGCMYLSSVLAPRYIYIYITVYASINAVAIGHMLCAGQLNHACMHPCNLVPTVDRST